MFPYPGNTYPTDMCSPTQESYITSDMFSPTRETHIPSDMCSLTLSGKHIFPVIYLFPFPENTYP